MHSPHDTKLPVGWVLIFFQHGFSHAVDRLLRIFLYFCTNLSVSLMKASQVGISQVHTYSELGTTNILE